LATITYILASEFCNRSH